MVTAAVLRPGAESSAELQFLLKQRAHRPGPDAAQQPVVMGMVQRARQPHVCHHPRGRGRHVCGLAGRQRTDCRPQCFSQVSSPTAHIEVLVTPLL